MLKEILVGALCVIIGFAVGFGYMFLIAKAMVSKVRAQEEARHRELLSQYADAAGPWIDVVNDIQEAVAEGKLSQKSVPDQIRILRQVISTSRGDGKDGVD